MLDVTGNSHDDAELCDTIALFDRPWKEPKKSRTERERAREGEGVRSNVDVTGNSHYAELCEAIKRGVLDDLKSQC